MKNRFISVFMFIVILLVGILPLFSASAQSDYSSVRVKISIGDTQSSAEVETQTAPHISFATVAATPLRLFILHKEASFGDK